MAKVIWRSGTVEVKASVLLMLMGLVLCLGNVAFAEEAASAATQQYNQGMDYLGAGQYAQAQQIFESLASDISEKELDFSSQDEIVDTVYLLADCYDKAGQSDKASELRQTIRNTWPDSSPAMLLRAHDIQTLIKASDIPAAQTEFGKLLDDFSGNPDLAKAIYWVANAYEKSGDKSKSVDLRRTIVETWPESQEAVRALSKIAIAACEDRDEISALGVIEKICADYGRIDGYVKVVYDVARHYAKLNEPEEASVFYREIIDKYPESEYALASGEEMVELYVEHGQIDQVESFLANHADQGGYDQVVYDVARHYAKLNIQEKARVLCQLIIAEFPENQSAMLATKELAVMAVRAGDDQTARDHYNNIIDNYLDYPDVAKEFMHIGEAYYKKALSGDSLMAGFDPNTQVGLVGNKVDPNSVNRRDLYFARTIEICKCILEKMPRPSKEKLLPEIHEMLASSYGFLGMHDLAITHYTTILETWPEYEKGWYIQYSIGKSYQQMKRLGSMPADEADNNTRIAYKQVIDEYPDCNAEKAVRNWLKRNP